MFNNIVSIPNFLLLAFIVLIFDANGQSIREEFGKNRIQYKTFDWQYYSTDDFDIYYYQGGKSLSKVAIDYLQKEFPKLTDLLGHQPYFKSKIFIYNSLADLQQSNVGIKNTVFKEGGQTNFIKSYVEIAYPGTVSEFKKELKFQTSRMIINDEMYGGDMAETFQNGFLLSLPEWYVNGAARYLAYGWDETMDDYIRDLMTTKRNYKKLSRYTGKDAAIIGQSIWNYIAQTYKKSSISYIMNLTRIVRDEEKSISTTLGLPGGFRQLINNWEAYYLKNIDQTKNEYNEIDKSLKSYKNRRRKFSIHDISFSPNGEKIAFARNLDGQYSVIVRNLKKNTERVVFKGGSTLLTQKVHQNIPIISWKDDETLGIVSVIQGKYVLLLNKLRKGNNERKELTRFSQVTDLTFSKSGSLAVLSGEMKGRSDIFIISMKKNGVKRVTKDIYDDRNPVFVPGRKQIVFSSNRSTDLLKTKDKDYQKLGDMYNLFLFDLDTTKTVIKRLTNTQSKDVQPRPINGEEFLYISDVKGINQIFSFNDRLSVSRQITKYANSIKTFDYHPQTKKAAFVMLQKGKERVFIVNNFNVKDNNFTKPTARITFEQANSVLKRLEKRKRKEMEERQQKQDSIDRVEYEKKLKEDLLKKKKDSIERAKQTAASLIDTDEVSFSSDDDYFNTDDYQFSKNHTIGVNNGQQITPAQNPSLGILQGNSYLNNYIDFVKVPEIRGPLPYQAKFTADNLITTWVVDPMRGFGPRIETRMSDILENNHLYGGIMFAADFKSGSDVFVEYEFLKYRLDFRAKYTRNSYNRTSYVRDNSHFNPSFTTAATLGSELENINQRFLLNKVELEMSLPISVTQRVSITPFFEKAETQDLNVEQYTGNANQVGRSADNKNVYLGFKFSYVFDNAVLRGLNILDGTRAKISYEKHYSRGGAPSFAKFKIDLRHYQPIHKEITWATRVFYGRNSSGIDLPKYLVGGVDNWVFRATEQAKDLNDPLLVRQDKNNSSLVFHDYTLNLRGVKYNKIYGSNTILFNTELRVPLIQYLTNKPITSNFMRNLLFVGFIDIGTAWDGDELLPETNVLNREVIAQNDKFTAIINNFNSPWLASYGFGARSVVLGFYSKVDVAWPYENFTFGKPTWHVSLGYDF